jgi:hypothetical protein
VNRAWIGSGPVRRSNPGADRIEELLGRYPELTELELHELIHWFEREASALDVALLASNEGIARGYGRFRAERNDPLDAGDIVRAVLGLAIVSAVVLGIGALAG